MVQRARRIFSGQWFSHRVFSTGSIQRLAGKRPRAWEGVLVLAVATLEVGIANGLRTSSTSIDALPGMSERFVVAESGGIWAAIVAAIFGDQPDNPPPPPPPEDDEGGGW